MGLTDFIKDQFIDVIEFVDDSTNKLLVYKYTREKDEIKQGAQLIVRNGQAAAFVHRGQLADVLGPGNYKLDTGNLPVLSSLAAIPYRFNSPIKSDLYFINTTQFINNKWGTKNPVIKRDPEMGLVRITAFGSFAFRVNDPELFMNEIFGARSLDLTLDIIDYLRSFVGEAVAQCLGETDASVLDLATHYGDLSSMITAYVSNKAAALGIEIPQVAVENIGLPEEVEKLIDEQSGIGLASRNMETFVQYQSARAIRDAASQPGGVAGLGAGIAVGKTVAASLNNALGNDAEKKAADTADDAMSVADTLEKYKDLLDKGILTQEEFDDLKAAQLKKL